MDSKFISPILNVINAGQYAQNVLEIKIENVI